VTARLTVAQTAETAHRHPVTIRDALQDGSLHGYQRVRRGRWLVDPECLDAWIEKRPCPHREATDKVVDLAARRATRGA
jgi:hypothetical protein